MPCPNTVGQLFCYPNPFPSDLCVRCALCGEKASFALARALHLRRPCALSLTKEPFSSSNQNLRRRSQIFRAHCGIRG